MNLPTWCPECGPKVDINEDGCCVTCGASATGRGAVAAHLAILERDEVQADLEDYRARNEVMRIMLERCATERDEVRAERDSAKLTATAATMAHDTIEKMVRFELRVGPEDSLHTAVQRVRYERDEARADVERLRAIDHTRSYGAIEEEIAAAYRRGAEAMREACVEETRRVFDAWQGYPPSLEVLHGLRALPIPEEP